VETEEQRRTISITGTIEIDGTAEGGEEVLSIFEKK
jgi:hypothetical protein